MCLPGIQLNVVLPFMVHGMHMSTGRPSRMPSDVAARLVRCEPAMSSHLECPVDPHRLCPVDPLGGTVDPSPAQTWCPPGSWTLHLSRDPGGRTLLAIAEQHEKSAAQAPQSSVAHISPNASSMSFGITHDADKGSRLEPPCVSAARVSTPTGVAPIPTIRELHKRCRLSAAPRERSMPLTDH